MFAIHALGIQQMQTLIQVSTIMDTGQMIKMVVNCLLQTVNTYSGPFSETFSKHV